MKSNKFKFRIYWKNYNLLPKKKSIIIYLYYVYKKAFTFKLKGILENDIFIIEESNYILNSMSKILKSNNIELVKYYGMSGIIKFPTKDIHTYIEKLDDFHHKNKILEGLIVFELIYKHGKFHGKKEKIREGQESPQG